jgi:hypothetical protein
MQLAMTPSDVSLLTGLLSPDLLGPTSGLSYDGTDISAPDNSALATAINAIVANSGWRTAGTQAQLKAYAASARYNKEIGGTTLSGVAYATDRETQAKLTSAYALSQVSPSTSFDWKMPNGSFTSLTASQLATVATAIGGFVQQCFAMEASVGASITGGSITTTAQIDAQFATF